MEKIAKYQKYASFSLILGPFIEPYAVSNGGTPMNRVFMLVNILIFLFYSRMHISRLKTLDIFVLYAFTVPTCIALYYGYTDGFIGSYLAWIFFVLNLYVVIKPYAQYEYVKKYYRYAVYLTIIVFVLQELSFIFLGKRFMVLIPFFHTVYQGLTVPDFINGMLSRVDRSCSMFLEPSHFAHFLIPYLAIRLGELNDNKKIFSTDVILISIVLLFLRSGNGLVMMAIIWLFAILFSNIQRIRKVLVLLPLCIIVTVFGTAKFSQTEMGKSIFERATELDTDFTRINSGFIRVWRGFFVFNDQPAEIQMFGAGYGAMKDEIHNSRYKWMFKDKDDVYLNNVQSFLMSYGYIGTCLFMIFLVSLVKQNRFGSLLCVVSFISLCFLDSFFCSTKMLLYISLPILLNKQKINKNFNNENIICSHS